MKLTRKMEQPKNIEQFSDEFLRGEIRRIEEAEIAKKQKGEYANPHFISEKNDKLADNLRPEDLDIYRDFIKQTLTPEKFCNYKMSMRNSKLNAEHPLARFAAWLSNQLFYEENQKWFNPRESEKE